MIDVLSFLLLFFNLVIISRINDDYDNNKAKTLFRRYLSASHRGCDSGAEVFIMPRAEKLLGFIVARRSSSASSARPETPSAGAIVRRSEAASPGLTFCLYHFYWLSLRALAISQQRTAKYSSFTATQVVRHNDASIAPEVPLLPFLPQNKCTSRRKRTEQHDDSTEAIRGSC